LSRARILSYRCVVSLSVVASFIVLSGCGVIPSTTMPSDVDPGSNDSGGGTNDGGGDTDPGGTNDETPPDGDAPPSDDPTNPPDGGGEPEPEPVPDPDPPPDEPDPTANAYCDPVADWPADWEQWEQEVLVLVNEQRAAGADCGSAGVFEPVDPLAMNSALRCAARNHSMDMFERDFFSHTNPDGDGPAARIDDAGYDGFTWGENIAWGYPTPESVIDGWMNSDGHCANIMRPFFTEIGVGYYEGNYWTQAFGGR
jgi:uncharacterized protein YkwD